MFLHRSPVQVKPQVITTLTQFGPAVVTLIFSLHYARTCTQFVLIFIIYALYIFILSCLTSSPPVF